MGDAHEASDPLRRIAQLEQENARLLRESEDIAAANVRAAMHLVELHEAREAELEAKNRAIAQALAAAEAASQQKSQFLANMSHELRTPLSGIVGMAELLQGTTLQAAQRDYVDAIVRTTDSFLELINQLLDFSKIEAGRLELEQVDVDLWQLLEDVACHLQVGADGKGLEFDFELDPAVPRHVVGDGLRLRQVLQNLASNALKFTIAGTVGLRVRCSDEATVVVEVADTGCGIPEDVARRLFAPFVQADVSTSRRFGGTGLGLVICRHLVQAMGGELHLRSQSGSGSVFTVQLPVAAATPAVASAPNGGRVAIAASPVLLARAARHLGAAGWSVVEDDVDAAAPTGLVVECAGDGDDDRRRLLDRFGGGLPVTVLLLRRPPGTAVAGDERFRCVQLPLRPTVLLRELAGPTAPVPPVAVTAADVAGLRVLVAEDTPVNRRVVEAHLQRLGCEVLCVPDGAQAVMAVREGDFDFVLMDCHMPVLDGYAATEAIRAAELGTGRRTPIVALSANALAGHREQCIAVGMDEQLAKPLRREELLAALRRFAVRRPRPVHLGPGWR